MSTLNVETRAAVGKTANKRLRETGRIPAVLYGKKAENVNLSVAVTELLPLLEKMGINSLVQIDEANINKLFNDVCGMRKKMKLDIQNPSLDEVKGWQQAN